MRVWNKTFLATVAICAIASLPALAAQGGNNSSNGNGKGNGNGGSNAGAPGPIAGAGLPFLLLAGGYALMRRYRSHKAE